MRRRDCRRTRAGHVPYRAIRLYGQGPPRGERCRGSGRGSAGIAPASPCTGVDDAATLPAGRNRPEGPPESVGGSDGTRVLHLDLHPDNVVLVPEGPRVIDWANAEEGDPGLDWGTSAVILAQVAVSAEPVAASARAMLTALLADSSGLTGEGLAEALRRRAGNPTMSPQETELLVPAAELVRSLTA
ncbi:phosphotransferase [Streptomyces sp. NBC_00199]|uniref:phosphotransferase family protein n=1 Tax=Streptomyces sp. NBC_00199 TaxID=2975678 RepID=UPI002B1D69A2|nr:phosphotransferase [Streptomyces sp. NBC_00199]